MAFRLDYGRLSKAERTPQGGLRVPAFVTRTGVFSYKTDDGRTVRELRHPDEVFNADSLATLEDCVLTDLHPGKVTSKEFKRLAIGHTRGAAKEDIFVKATVVVQDAASVEAVEKGSRKEISCGYSCDIDPTPGEYNGEKYDCIQTNIRYNHVALGPENWGRAGNRVALHLDSGDAVMDCGIVEREDTPTPRPIVEHETINGIQYKVGSPEHIQALRQRADSEKSRADAAEAKVTTEKARADKAEGERDSFKNKLAEVSDPKRFDDAVNARIDLHAKARKVLGKDADFSGKSDRDVMSAVVTKADSSFKMDDKTSDDYLRGRFEAAVSSPAATDSAARVRKDAKTATETPPPAGSSPAQKREDQRKANANAWQQPLSLSKQK